jgi:hypothetical protein
MDGSDNSCKSCATTSSTPMDLLERVLCRLGGIHTATLVDPFKQCHVNETPMRTWTPFRITLSVAALEFNDSFAAESLDCSLGSRDGRGQEWYRRKYTTPIIVAATQRIVPDSTIPTFTGCGGSLHCQCKINVDNRKHHVVANLRLCM